MVKPTIPIFIILAIGIIGFGIYAINGESGNGSGDILQRTNSLQNQAAAISPQKSTIKRDQNWLKPFVKGQMAGFRIIDKPLDLTEVRFTDETGEDYILRDWNGKVVLLNLWATWCPPCRHEMPGLDDLQIQLGGDKFEVVTVSIDMNSPEKPMKFLSENKLHALKFYWDGTTKIFGNLKKKNLAFGMPTTVLIDETGHALAVMNGPAIWNSKEAIALISGALGNEPNS